MDLITKLAGPGSLPLTLAVLIVGAVFLGSLIGSHTALYRALYFVAKNCLGCDPAIHDKAFEAGKLAEREKWEACRDLIAGQGVFSL